MPGDTPPVATLKRSDVMRQVPAGSSVPDMAAACSAAVSSATPSHAGAARALAGGPAGPAGPVGPVRPVGPAGPGGPWASGDPPHDARASTKGHAASKYTSAATA